jgi:hypothetical protein
MQFFMRTSMMTETEQLPDEVVTEISPKEKLANSESPDNNPVRTFTAVDMWNRNRQSRSASSFLRKWELN